MKLTIYQEHIQEKMNELYTKLDREMIEHDKEEVQKIYRELDNLGSNINFRERAIKFYKEYYTKKLIELQDEFSITTDQYYKLLLNDKMNIINSKLNDI